MKIVIFCGLLIVGLLVACEGISCPEKGAEDIMMPDTKCTKYISCRDGEGEVKHCPMLKLFDAVTRTCEWRFKVDCGAVPPEFPPKTWKPDPDTMDF